MQGFKILIALCAFVSLAAAKKNVCSNKEDGTFLPVTGSCSKYIICSNGKALEQDCGVYHYSTKYNVCDLPERVGCAVQEYKPMTTSIPKKPSTDKEIIVPNPTLPPCYAVANGISLPVPGNDRQYYFCMNNKAFLKDCGNLYFDVKYSVCNVKPDNSESAIVEKPFYTTVPPKATSSQPQTETSVCVGKQNGVLLAIRENPQQYHFCLNNKAFLKDCGSNMVFSSQYSACTVAAEEESVAEEEFLETEVNKAIARKVCANKRFGTRLGFPGSCSLYVICTENAGFVKTCGWRYFNSNTASCDTPKNVNCQKQVEEEIAHPQIQTTTKPVVKPLAQTICLNQKDGAFVASPGKCSDFFFCLRKQGYAKSCGKDQHFDPNYMICVKSSASKCVDIVSKKSQRAIMPRADSSCASQESGTLLSSPGNCNSFIICDNGVSREMNCPAGLHFNANEKICDWPTNAQCA